MAKNVNMEVRKANAMKNLGVEGGETAQTPLAKGEKNPPLLQEESVKSTGASVRTGPSCEDELERLYESRKTAAPPPTAVRPKEPRAQPADVPYRPPDPLYVRRVGQRFWSTKRILDWQRQALRAREDTEVVLKPLREYGEESALKGAEGGEVISKGPNENDGEHKYYQYNKNHGHIVNDEEHKYYQYNKNHAHYENDEKHGHYENDREHGHYENDREHGHYENDREHGHYENDREHGHYENDGEHGHYENDREHGHYENDREHGHYENDREHGHYENDGEHGHYENDREHGHYENDREHGHYENDREHGHYDNDREHAHYENDGEHVLYENDGEHGHYENDGEHGHYENDEELSNLSTHVYADLDPDFLSAQDAIRLAAAQPFYEMDISPADEEQESPFYKMDVTAAKDKQQQQQQPFYEMEVASADEKDKAFYEMDDNQLGQPTSNDVYADLDPEFVTAQDAVRTGNRTREGSRDGDDDPRCSQNCRVFLWCRPGCMVGVCAGVIIAVIVATVVAVIFNQRGVLSTSIRSDDMLNQTTLPTTSTMSSAQLPGVTSQATWCTTEGRDWQLEWTLYIRDYFGEDSDVGTALEDSYAANEVVMSLLQDRFFWYWTCRYWFVRGDLPCTLSKAVTFCVVSGTEYMTSHGFSAYSEFFSSVLNALEALPNVTTSTGGNKIGDDGVRAIAETFHHLKKLRDIDITGNSITKVGGEAMAKSLVHLQELQKLYLSDNALALSLSSLAKAFVNMPRLGFVDLFGVTCKAASFRMAAQQARDAVHTIAGRVGKFPGGALLYDGSRAREDNTQELAWQRVKQELQTGVRISGRQLTVSLQIRLLEK
ncbi:NLRC5 [Branchiostoma lanceolatum]|uniref:NLRC5 protein n=1 Tax=Branchiostoma lanceolatum TaxID=7740 RepID=A0A8J9VX92_BRALA|nr:NLRC5 [Branchiostoma lanceolatum]